MPNGPRTSAGAAGFGSQVSMWLGPPPIQYRMTAVSLRGFAASSAGRLSQPREPSRRKPRRLTIESMSVHPAVNSGIALPSWTMWIGRPVKSGSVTFS